MKLSVFLLAAYLTAITAPAAYAGEAADNDDKKPIYVINGKRAEPFDPTIVDMSAFKKIVKESQTVKLAAKAGISEQELAEHEAVFLKSKKQMQIATKGQSVDYTGTIWCEGHKLPNIYIMTRQGETNADGKFNCQVKYGTKGYVVANGCKNRRITFAADLRKKITLNPVGFKSDTTANKKPKYHVVNGVYVSMFNIDNYEPDEIISVKHVWEQTDEVCSALAKAHIKPKFAEQYGVEVVILREGVQLAKRGRTYEYALDIRDREGNPVSGAKIFVEKTHSDFQGNFTLTADCGTKAMAIYRNNALKTKRFTFGATPAIDFELERNPQNDATNNGTFVKVDAMPRYMGGDLTTFRNWVMNGITYPIKMQNLGIEGRVLVGFTVNKEGFIEDIEIIRSPHDDFSNEVIKVLKRSKKWTPGCNAGQLARVRFVIPIDFNIR